ncbi:hypothetical protein C4D60_Mb08t19600 [Musa balbisiana]|uniref:Uncharacterized protein n=1 Tax=Musa balbisiana TaxID=52838 RepID=A0A4S8K4Y7_MUSBA|nr:hypothetical protein C4D60_Mb08t19600 [Musa balbisiana]
MAAISTSVASSSSPALKQRMVISLSLSLSLAAYCKLLPQAQRSPTFRCSTSRRDGRRAPPLLQLAVGGVTEILRLLSPKKQRDEAKDTAQAPSLARSVDDVVRILRADYDRNKIRDRYSQNLDLLVPFFDRPSLTLENIEKVSNLASVFGASNQGS